MKKRFVLPACLMTFALTACGGLSEADAIKKAQAILDKKAEASFAYPDNQHYDAVQKSSTNGTTNNQFELIGALIKGSYYFTSVVSTTVDSETQEVSKLNQQEYLFEKDGTYYSGSCTILGAITIKQYTTLTKSDFDDKMDDKEETITDTVASYAKSCYSSLQSFVTSKTQSSSSSSSSSEESSSESESSSDSYTQTASYSYASSGDGNLSLKGSLEATADGGSGKTTVDLEFDNYLPTASIQSGDITSVTTSSSDSSASITTTTSYEANLKLAWNSFDVTYIDFVAEGYTKVN